MLIAAQLVTAASLHAQTYAPPTAADFGGLGPFAVFVDGFTNPVYPTANGATLTVSIYHPNSIIDPALPTIFFAHGYTSPIGSPAAYSALLTNLASCGYNVVFSPYEGGVGLNIPKRFDELTTGCNAAVTNFGLNTGQIGFVGHSYGGGFLPAVLQHLMMGKSNQYRAGQTWGGTAAFMFALAPGYAYDGGGQTDITGSQTIVFPTNLNVGYQVFFDDNNINDPRVALDIFYNCTTLNSQKEFLTVFGDNHGTPAQVASHFLPTTSGSMTTTSLQAWAIFRHLQAMAAWTFSGNLTAREIALGNGTTNETFTGVWSDNVPVTPLGVSDVPSPSAYPASSNFAAVSWTSTANPRRNFPLVSGPPGFTNLTLRSGEAWLTTGNLLPGHSYALQATMDLSSGNWSNAVNFTAAQTSQVLTNATGGIPRQFWRVFAP